MKEYVFNTFYFLLANLASVSKKEPSTIRIINREEPSMGCIPPETIEFWDNTLDPNSFPIEVFSSVFFQILARWFYHEITWGIRFPIHSSSTKGQ